MRESIDPDSPDALVDKLIGSAYAVVKLVAANLKQVCYVAANMAHVYAAAQVVSFDVATPSTLGASATVTYLLPAGFVKSKLRGLEVVGLATPSDPYSAIECVPTSWATVRYTTDSVQVVFLAGSLDAVVSNTLRVSVRFGSD